MSQRMGRTERCEGLIEGLNWSRLRGVDLPCGDRGSVVVFAADGCPSKSAEHSELARMSEGVGDGALEEALDRRA